MEQIFFLIFATIAVGSALGVVTFRNPVYCAISLMVCFVQVAALFVLLRSPFLAVVQVFIYIGAVMVLFLFAVMLLDMRKTAFDAFAGASKPVMLSALVVLAGEIILIILGSSIHLPALTQAGEETTVEVLGKELFTSYIFPFEVVSVLLLVAMIGAIIMAKEWRR